jgi:tRNA nucleotidyltransferase/poly(A) polymerase
VGGSVRDVLFDITTNPTDIDITCAMLPDEVFSMLQKFA